MFDKKGEASFTLLSTCQVTYINTKHKDTFGKSGAKVVSIIIEDSGEEIQGNILTGKLAEQVRSGEIKNITVHLE
jgi:hypothetical protein